MITPTMTALDELCVLISAQIDTLEALDPLTPDQLCEYQSRAEKIRVLCGALEQMNETETEEECLSVA